MDELKNLLFCASIDFFFFSFQNATVGQAISQVFAKDEDVGLNALVKYRLKPDLFGNYKTFSINENTGLLTLRTPLDRERQKLYEVKLNMKSKNYVIYMMYLSDSRRSL